MPILPQGTVVWKQNGNNPVSQETKGRENPRFSQQNTTTWIAPLLFLGGDTSEHLNGV